MAIQYVSVSAYEDADLLDACLESIRDVLGDVEIAVVDGKYETWPSGEPNSTDDTEQVSEDWGAEYVPGGPYERERDKHIDRVELAPDHRRALFMDADERLLQADVTSTADDEPDWRTREALLPRIVNAKVYSDGPIARWPRSFYPETVKAVNRWDAYLFTTSVSRTDGITIVHRHDLRDREYREQKYERIRAEDREPRYNDHREEQYYRNEFDVETWICPECREDSLVLSPATNADGDGMTRVAICLSRDSCYREIEPMTVDEYRYLPESWERGLKEDPRRLQTELIDAGCVWASGTDLSAADVRPRIAHWIHREYGTEVAIDASG